MPGQESDALYAQLSVYEGRAAAIAGRGKDPVNAPMIRHWCEAMGDTSEAYRGPDAIAPPTMLQAWTMGGLSGHSGGAERADGTDGADDTGRTDEADSLGRIDAGADSPGRTDDADGTGRSAAYDEMFALLDGAGYTSVVATDCEQEYLRPLRPGDRITFDTVIESVSPRKTTKLGTGYFVTTRTDVRADGEPAGTHRFRILKYRPAQRRQAPRNQAARNQAARNQAARSQAPRGQAARSQAARSQAAPNQAAAQEPPLRPRPVINRDNAGFWAGVAEHRLLIQRCTDCATLRLPWLPGCNACGGAEWDTVDASGEGTVFSHVVMHHPPFPAFSPSGEGGPYAVALVELAEGVRVVSNVIGVPYDKVRVGMPVQLEFLVTDPDLELPVFRSSEGG